MARGGVMDLEDAVEVVRTEMRFGRTDLPRVLRSRARERLEDEAVSVYAAHLAQGLEEVALAELEKVRDRLARLEDELEVAREQAREANERWAEVRWRSEDGIDVDEKAAPLREDWQEAEDVVEEVAGLVNVLRSRQTELAYVVHDCRAVCDGVAHHGVLSVLREF